MSNRRRKRTGRVRDSPDARALTEAQEALDRHRESLDVARRARDGSIEDARETLRTYKAPLSKAVDGHRKRLADEMKALDRFDAPLREEKKRLRRHAPPAESSKDM